MISIISIRIIIIIILRHGRCCRRCCGGVWHSCCWVATVILFRLFVCLICLLVWLDWVGWLDWLMMTARRDECLTSFCNFILFFRRLPAKEKRLFRRYT